MKPWWIRGKTHAWITRASSGEIVLLQILHFSHHIIIVFNCTKQQAGVVARDQLELEKQPPWCRFKCPLCARWAALSVDVMLFIGLNQLLCWSYFVHEVSERERQWEPQKQSCKDDISTGLQFINVQMYNIVLFTTYVFRLQRWCAHFWIGFLILSSIRNWTRQLLERKHQSSKLINWSHVWQRKNPCTAKLCSKLQWWNFVPRP